MTEITKINYNKDLSEVVKLIQNGLDATYSDSFFTWKHLENPYGKSYGLVARNGGKIVGLRMFMYWEFWDGNSKRKIRAIRPVDTVVDKNYQGQGLFKKLTLHGLELCEGQYDLVFNTPNVNSLPGYKKMGWSQSENSGFFSLGLINLFGKGINVENLKGKFPEVIPKTNKKIGTHLTSQYLNWRYTSEEYEKIYSGNNYIVFSKRKLNFLPVIIIYELIGDKVMLQKMLVALFKKTFIPLIYFFNNHHISLGLLKVISKKKGIIAFKNDSLKIKDGIIFSIGDLEGKL